MNNVFLIGRTTKDPEIRYSQNNLAIARFTLAVDRVSKEKETDFISCIAFGKTAELMEKYVPKGRKIAIQGHIQTGSYDAKDGHKVYTTDVIVERLEFCESKQSNDGGNNASNNQDGGDGFVPAGDEALPFV